ncbi:MULTISPECIES: hypothetical protein [Paraburkholderia]|nr:MULTISPECIES: hypothetical protein [Paraburkholderia]
MTASMEPPVLRFKLPPLLAPGRVIALCASIFAGAAIDLTAAMTNGVGLPVAFTKVPLSNLTFIGLAWLIAWAFASVEDHRPYGASLIRNLWALFYYGGGSLLIVRFVLLLADQVDELADSSFRATPLEGMVPGFWLCSGVIAALVLVPTLVYLPRLLGRLQFAGRITSLAADECLWFAAVVWSMGALGGWGYWVSSIHDYFFRPFSQWATVIAFVSGRVWYARPDAHTPASLVIVMLDSGNPRSLRRLISRLAGYWSPGPVTLIAPAADAPALHGAYARVAARAGRLDLLFPRAAPILRDLPARLPPEQSWKALPARELYPYEPLLAESFSHCLSPESWVLLVAGNEDLAKADQAKRRLDGIRALLPLGRTFVLTSEVMAASLQGLHVRLLGRHDVEAALTLANRLYNLVRPPDPPPPPALPWKLLVVNGFAVVLLFCAAAASVPHTAGTVAWLSTGISIAINQSVAAACAIFARRLAPGVAPLGEQRRLIRTYLLSGLLAMITVGTLSTVNYVIRTFVAEGSITPFYIQIRWLIQSIVLSVALAWCCDNFAARPVDPRWLKWVESAGLAVCLAVTGLAIMKWTALDLARLPHSHISRLYFPVVFGGGVGGLFGWTVPSWYRRTRRRLRTDEGAPADFTPPSFTVSGSPP